GRARRTGQPAGSGRPPDIARSRAPRPATRRSWSPAGRPARARPAGSGTARTGGTARPRVTVPAVGGDMVAQSRTRWTTISTGPDVIHNPGQDPGQASPGTASVCASDCRPLPLVATGTLSIIGTVVDSAAPESKQGRLDDPGEPRTAGRGVPLRAARHTRGMIYEACRE